MLVVPDAAPAFGDQNSSHLFKWYSEEFSADQSVLYSGKTVADQNGCFFGGDSWQPPLTHPQKHAHTHFTFTEASVECSLSEAQEPLISLLSLRPEQNVVQNVNKKEKTG